MSTHLIDSLATTGALAAVFSDAAILQAMLDFEIALARAEADAGVIPAKAAESIARAAGADAFDAHQIAIDARASATIAIPFVKALRARVAAIDADAARYVHWGATSQDVVDTALVRCIAHAGRVLDADHARLARALTRTSEAHAGTVMLGRTLLQPALPITFGLKAAGWLGAVTRSAARLFAAARRRACAPVWRRGGNPGGAWRSRPGRRAGPGRRARAGRARRALACASRSAGGAGRLVRRLHRHARQDRARRVAADAGRSRRGRRARRRLLDDAAEAQPGRLRRGHSRPQPACRAWWRRFCPAWRRSTSAASAAGRRRGPPSSRRSRRPARPCRRWSMSSRASASLRIACAPTSPRPTAWSSPRS